MLNYLIGLVVFIVALLVSVMLHEFGHFSMAKRYGMKVTQFFCGFGQTLWSIRRGDTEYGFKALPFGGFVKIVGMSPAEPVPPADEARAFYRHPAWQRVVVLCAGSFMHFVLAFVLLMGFAMGLGQMTAGTATTTADQVPKCLPSTATGEPPASCDPSTESPAYRAGLRPGDDIVGFNGTQVRSWSQLTGLLSAAGPGTEVTLTVDRSGRQRQLGTVPLAKISGRGGGYLGLTSRVVGQHIVRKNPVDAAGWSVSEIGSVLKSSGQVAVQLPASIPKVFSRERSESPNGGPVSAVGAGRATADVFASHDSAYDKAAFFLGLVISINVFVGAFNMIPLLPLDGGHVAVICYERLRTWFARRRGRGDPGPVDVNKLMPITYAALLLLVGLGVLLVLADLINPVKVVQ